MDTVTVVAINAVNITAFHTQEYTIDPDALGM